MTTEEKLKNFYEFSMESAKNEGKQILDEYQASLDKVFAEHKAEKESQAEAALRDETARIHRDSNKALSDEQIKIKRTLSEKQAAIRGALFAETAKKFQAYKTTPDYRTYLFEKINDAKNFAGDTPMVVYIDPSDSDLLSDIKAQTGIHAVTSKTPFTGGMRAVIESKHILIDNSYDTLSKEAESNFVFD